MSPKPTPAWVHYRPQQPLLHLVSVSISAELAHRRFADYHWSTGLWPAAPPADGPALARVAPAAWPGLVRELRLLGWRRRGRRLVCPAIAAVRSHAVRAYRVARSTGSKGGTTTSHRRKDAQGTLVGPLPGPLQGSLPQIQIQIQNKNKDVALPDATVPCSPVAPLKAREGEKEFRRQLVETLELWKKGGSVHEITNWGGWWRNRYRQNPDKAQRVLAEIRSMIRERAIHGNPGAAAVDLWNRLP